MISLNTSTEALKRGQTSKGTLGMKERFAPAERERAVKHRLRGEILSGTSRESRAEREAAEGFYLKVQEKFGIMYSLF